KNRQWSRAETLLTRLAQRGAPAAEDLALRAELELGRGRVDQAVYLMTAVPESDPLAARARLLAGPIEKGRDRTRRMEALFLDSPRLPPRLARARGELVFLYAMQPPPAELKAQFRALAELEPLNYDDVFLWMNSFEDLWVNDVIRSYLERYLAADPEDRL